MDTVERMKDISLKIGELLRTEQPPSIVALVGVAAVLEAILTQECESIEVEKHHPDVQTLLELLPRFTSAGIAVGKTLNGPTVH